MNKQETLLKLYGTTNPYEAWSRRDEAGYGDASTWRQWVTMDFPYYAPEHELPRPLPTIAEIEAARNTKDDLTHRTAKKSFVYRVDGVFAVKIRDVPTTLQEAENLLFLEKHSQMRVPKVYAAYRIQGLDPCNYLHYCPTRFPDRDSLPALFVLVMEYIDGTPLAERFFRENPARIDDSWETYTQTKRDNITKKFKEQLELFRSISPPADSYYGRINGQPWSPCTPVIMCCTIPTTMVGPFDRHEDFVNTMFDSSLVLSALDTNKEGEEFDPGVRDLLERFKKNMSFARATEPVLTHLDLKDMNVFLVGNPNDPEDPDVVIIDWEYMSWMPAYMEAVVLRSSVKVLQLFRPVYADSWPLIDYLSNFLRKTHNYIA